MRFLRILLLLGVPVVAFAAQDDDRALPERARAALRKAVEFCRMKVSTEGGYHFAYAGGSQLRALGDERRADPACDA